MTNEAADNDGQKILDQLGEGDPTTSRFSPWGLGGPLPPAVSAEFVGELINRARLVDDVPEDIRLSFERVRTTFLHGLLDYDLFTAAYSLGHLALEGALRARFVSYYDNQIPILREGVPETLAVAGFGDYYDTIRRGKKLQLAGDPPEPLPRSYPALYAWARRRGLLIGQRNVGVSDSIVRVRNVLAHPEAHTVHTPISVSRFLRDLAEIVNRLWGHDTEGGRLFPGPIHRWARAAAIAPEGAGSVTFGSLAQVRPDPKRADWTYAVYLAWIHRYVAWESSGPEV